jgi:tRNA1Val (adenine37-N6)-methyltransferase
MERAIARHEIKGTLQDLISIVSYLLPNKGRFYLIYPASRTIDLFVALRSKRLEPKRLQFAHPRADEVAKFVLAEAIKSSGVELKIMEPLILHNQKLF